MNGPVSIHHIAALLPDLISGSGIGRVTALNEPDFVRLHQCDGNDHCWHKPGVSSEYPISRGFVPLRFDWGLGRIEADLDDLFSVLIKIDYFNNPSLIRGLFGR